jgi:hypothetical protein
MAMTAAPMIPAAPKLALLTEAPPVEDPPLAVFVPVPDEDVDAAGVVAVVVGFVVVGMTAAVVLGDVTAGAGVELELEAPLALPAEVLAADVDPAALVKQLLEDPALMVNGADWAMSPLLSRIVRPMEVPAARLVGHVTEVPVCWPRSWIAGAPGWPPGWILKK